MTELTDRSLGLGHGDLGKREVAVCLPQTSLVKFSLRTYLVVHYSNHRGYAVKMKLILPQVVGFTFSSGTFTDGSTKGDITKLDVSFWKKSHIETKLCQRTLMKEQKVLLFLWVFWGQGIFACLYEWIWPSLETCGRLEWVNIMVTQGYKLCSRQNSSTLSGKKWGQ